MRFIHGLIDGLHAFAAALPLCVQRAIGLDEL